MCIFYVGINNIKDTTPVKKKPIFEAESPDELALVETAYAYNIQLINRTPTSASVNILGRSDITFIIQCYLLLCRIKQMINLYHICRISAT